MHDSVQAIGGAREPEDDDHRGREADDDDGDREREGGGERWFEKRRRARRLRDEISAYRERREEPDPEDGDGAGRRDGPLVDVCEVDVEHVRRNRRDGEADEHRADRHERTERYPSNLDRLIVLPERSSHRGEARGDADVRPRHARKAIAERRCWDARRAIATQDQIATREERNDPHGRKERQNAEHRAAAPAERQVKVETVRCRRQRPRGRKYGAWTPALLRATEPIPPRARKKDLRDELELDSHDPLDPDWMKVQRERRIDG